MVTKIIDVPLPPELEKFLSEPVCISLPQPGTLSVQLPTGGSIKGLVDVTKSIPDDCSLSFSLVLPMLTFLGNFECLFKLLKLITPLIDVVKGLGPPPDLPKLGKAIPDFLEAAEELAPCLAIPTPVAMAPFVRDLLCLIIKLLNCVVGLLKTIMSVLGDLALQIQSAQACRQLGVAGGARMCGTECADIGPARILGARPRHAVALVGRAVSRHCGRT